MLLQALRGRNALSSPEGHIAMGWLIVEDLAMVIVLVIVPIFATRGAQGASIASLAAALAVVLGKIVIFGVLALYVGTRFVPWLLMRVTRTGSQSCSRSRCWQSRLALPTDLPKLSMSRLHSGAFFAGVVLSESALSKRAAADTLPLKDAFAVLFFVSVGMLFDPAMLLRTPLEVLAVVARHHLRKGDCGLRDRAHVPLSAANSAHRLGEPCADRRVLVHPRRALGLPGTLPTQEAET